MKGFFKPGADGPLLDPIVFNQDRITLSRHAN